MGAHERVSVEEVVQAYKETGSVWKAAKRLGLCGQSVWERLKHIGWTMTSTTWGQEEIDELLHLAESLTIGEIARRLGRPYSGVACQLSARKIPMYRHGAHLRKLPRGIGLDKVSVKKHLGVLEHSSLSVLPFCRANGLNIDMFIEACQKYFRDRWEAYAKTHTTLEAKTCPYCQRSFYPMNGKQITCSRKCQKDARCDRQYFGGNRRNTIGLAEGICQLCGRQNAKGLSSHHVLGKENDPNNSVLIALCPGCHQMVGGLAKRKFSDTEIGWENLITLVMARRLADRNGKEVAVHACVDLEWLTAKDIDVEEAT